MMLDVLNASGTYIVRGIWITAGDFHDLSVSSVLLSMISYELS